MPIIRSQLADIRRDTGHLDTAFRYVMEGNVEVFYWIDCDLGYPLSAGISHGERQQLADAANRQIGR